ncbi:hypothetical protein [Mycobacterium conspicuum]|jgi:hypothetical protein|uniref:Uncharacterized protein n=1 Tax=Mycobacterium conspicuum TaxID=44010 RepID=A0A1X1TA48_9MYCO|nr:hypothetical protein [Mycobacterium conspicuum]ORV41454.1 hypothetical protein AWC00_14680 [Mycobacterium conspicuum]BBZ37527.1 hypothetical protein MCNS_05900 [Mycobacterium conspicuum]
MPRTANAKTAFMTRVVGFLAVVAGLLVAAALLVLFAAAAHAALASSPGTDRAVGMHRPGAAPHVRHAHSGLRKDGGRHRRPAHQSRQASGCRPCQHRPPHGSARTYLASMGWTHKTVHRVQGGHHHAQGHAQPGWLV